MNKHDIRQFIDNAENEDHRESYHFNHDIDLIRLELKQLYAGGMTYKYIEDTLGYLPEHGERLDIIKSSIKKALGDPIDNHGFEICSHENYYTVIKKKLRQWFAEWDAQTIRNGVHKAPDEPEEHEQLKESL